MNRSILAIILFTTACATTQHPALDGLRDQFVVEGRDRGVVLHPETVRLAFPNQSPRLVEISQEFWNDSFYADDTRRQVVYHELGHCLLGIREHVQNLSIQVFGEKHISMMEREAIPYNYYHGHEAEWLDRLFGRDLRASLNE